MGKVLIVGASRGIGLALTAEFLSRGWKVLATERAPSAGLDALAAGAGGALQRATLTLGDRLSEQAFAGGLGGSSFAAIVMNAGIFGPAHQSLEASREEVGALVDVNALAPVRLAHRLMPHLAVPEGVLAFMTSRLGSLSENLSGGMDLYRLSKAALNMLTRSLAAGNEVRGLTVLNLHPGWVKTDMGGEAAPLDAATSARGLAQVIIDAAGRGGQHFLDHQGATIPW
ncbi:SDR family NAD(P)-dependent oxidoreductase [Thermaurantiacus sp.]